MRAPYRAGYFLLPRLEPQRARPPVRAEGWYGRLSLTGVCEQPVHVGSGAPERVRLAGRAALVEGLTTVPSGRGPAPLIPGSSWKGAVRAVIEAVTPSCERPSREGCRTPKALCPACALLGAPGWRATVMFSDLRPRPGTAPAPASVAQRYSHASAPARGRRLYRREPEEPQPQEREVLLVLPKGTELEGEVAIAGAADEGLGLLTLALGLPPHGLPYLRVGGGKNRGLGVVRFARAVLEGGRGLAAVVGTRGADLTDRIGAWQEAAVRRFPPLKERLAVVRSHY